ncbi:MAG TPA: nucleotidyltransferase domain-containing protein [Ignavibacteriaceae bacterium]|nr:nucleotidyltransferase domain-containing protein [Ignavibacteriaceae bacterium]
MSELQEKKLINMIGSEISRFSDNLKGYKVLLYGSRVSGKPGECSDFDLAILGKKALPLKLFHEIADSIENLSTLHEIEIVDLKRTSDKFRMEVLKNYKVIYE